MRLLPLILWLLGLGSLLQAEAPPNLLLILTDDAGYADFGFQQSRNDFAGLTPHLDTLAARSVRFQAAYVTAAICCPSRAGLLTGQDPQRFGFEANVTNYPGTGLPGHVTTLAEQLQSRGYRTFLIGKWHLGLESRFHPNRHGFDDFHGFLAGSRTYFATDTFELEGERLQDNGVLLQDPPGLYLTDYFSDVAIAKLQAHTTANPGQPFFLTLAYNAVHTPLDADDPRLGDPRIASITPDQRRTLAAMTIAIDDGIGRLLAALEQLNLTRDTLILFVNDNGGPEDTAPSEPNWSDNQPLRGRKALPYEGGLRVPMFLSWSNGLESRFVGAECFDPVSTLDIAPTFLEAATPGEPLPPELDGISLFETLAADAPSERALFWRNSGISDGWSAARIGPWKFVRQDGARQLPELYQLETDPSESRDLARDYPGILRTLLDAHAEWEAGVLDPLWGKGTLVASSTALRLRSSPLGLALIHTRPGEASARGPWRHPLRLDRDWQLRWEMRCRQGPTGDANGAILLDDIQAGLCLATQQLFIHEPGQGETRTPLSRPIPPGSTARLQLTYHAASRSLTLTRGRDRVTHFLQGRYPRDVLRSRGYLIEGITRTDFTPIQP